MLNKIDLKSAKTISSKLDVGDNDLSRMSILEDDDSRCSFLNEERPSMRIEEGVEDTTRRSSLAFLFKKTNTTPTPVGKFGTGMTLFYFL
jgi:hypothetical protein